MFLACARSHTFHIHIHNAIYTYSLSSFICNAKLFCVPNVFRMVGYQPYRWQPLQFKFHISYVTSPRQPNPTKLPCCFLCVVRLLYAMNVCVCSPFFSLSSPRLRRFLLISLVISLIPTLNRLHLSFLFRLIWLRNDIYNMHVVLHI